MQNISATTGSNNTTSSSSEDLPSKTEGLVFCTVFALEAVLIVAGNLLTIVLFARNKNLRKKSLFLVINMAFADLMLGTVGIPLYIYDIGAQGYFLWTAKMSKSFYDSVKVADTLFAQASIISATFISAERCYAIYWPLKHRTLSMRAYRIVIFVVWTLAAVVTTNISLMCLLISCNYAFYVFIIYAPTLLFIVCGCNIGIWRKFRSGRMASQQQNRAVQNQRLTKTLLFVSIIALISWLPLIIGNLLVLNGVSVPVYPYFFIFDILNYSNSFLNPVIYALRIPEYKQALGLCCFRRQAAINQEDNERRYNRAAALTPTTQLRTFPTHLCHLNMAYENDVLDTKL